MSNQVIVELRDEEALALSKLAMALGMSENSVMRSALRLYQTVSGYQHSAKGSMLAFLDGNGDVIASSLMIPNLQELIK